MNTTTGRARVKLTAEEKRFHDAQYRVTTKEFKEVLANLNRSIADLFELDRFINPLDRSSSLKFLVPGTAVAHEYTHKDQKNAIDRLYKDIKDLATYFRVSKKKYKAPLLPSDFKGTYVPAFGAGALREFLNYPGVKFGMASLGKVPQWMNTPLMDVLPNAKQGYFLRNTLTMLFYIYGRANNMQIPGDSQYVKATREMRETFGRSPPIFIYNKVGDKLVKYPAPAGTTDTTFTSISRIYPPGTVNKKGKPADFNPDKFMAYFYQNIAASNYYSETNLPKAADFDRQIEALEADSPLREQLMVQKQGFAQVLANMRDPNFRANLLAEHQIVEQVNLEWGEKLEPGKKEEQKQKKKQKAEEEKRRKAQLLSQSQPIGATLTPAPQFVQLQQ